MFDLDAVQNALREQQFDGWLLYDFRGLNVLARRVLGLASRCHAVAALVLLRPGPGRAAQAGASHRIRRPSTPIPASRMSICAGRSWKRASASWSPVRARVAMEYVPRNANPYVSRVDAGTVELVRSCGVEVVPSGDLVQLFEACWDDEQWAMHLEAAQHTRSAYDVAFGFIARARPRAAAASARPRCSR